MKWHKIIFSLDQFADGDYERMHNYISDVTMRDPRRYADVAIFMPTSQYFEKYGCLTRTAFFTPDTALYFSDLLRRYGAEPCDPPLRSEVGAVLTSGLSELSHLWQA